MKTLKDILNEGLIGSRTRGLKNTAEIIDSWTDAMVAAIEDYYMHDDIRGPHNEAVYGLYSLLDQEAGKRGVEMIRGKDLGENGKDWKDKVIIIFMRNARWKNDIDPMRLNLIMGAEPKANSIYGYINLASNHPFWEYNNPSTMWGLERGHDLQLKCTDDDRFIPFEITPQSSLFRSLQQMILRIHEEAKSL